MNTAPDQTTAASQRSPSHLSTPALGLAALGVVFGDIGTNPLYTLKTVLEVTGGARSEPAAILGPLSLILWTLIIVTSLKYVTVALRVDNGGEGGILALMALLRRMPGRRPLLITLFGLFGAALVYGDAAITPAISVMSALEGLNIVAPHLQRYVLPAAVVTLVALFAVQRQGTARIGRLLGPVMLIWFVTIALLGLRGMAQHPAVLWALNPAVGLRYLYGLRGNDRVVAPSATPGSAPRVISYKSTMFDVPILEYRPYRSFSSNQSSTVLVRLFGAADVPHSGEVVAPVGAPNVDLRTVWSVGLRFMFDCRYYP